MSAFRAEVRNTTIDVMVMEDQNFVLLVGFAQPLRSWSRWLIDRPHHSLDNFAC